MKPSKCNDCQYSKIGEDFVPCFECMIGIRNHFVKKEDVKMSKVTIEYDKVKSINATTLGGRIIKFENYKTELALDINNFGAKQYYLFDKQTAIELVAALNELVKQL